MVRLNKIRMLLPVAFVILSAAVFGAAQQLPPAKHNTRPEAPAAVPAQPKETSKDSTRYSYEFTQPDFLIKHIIIEHDASGHGRIRFVQRSEETFVEEPLQLSAEAMSRISGLWEGLRFLDSTESYQSDRSYPHLGTMRLKMERDTRQRTAEFNWTNHAQASSLVTEYRRAADQAILVFDLSVARESLRLNTPKLMEHMESLLKRNGLSDPKQLLPLLKDISTDDHIPLIARNHALRLIKKIEK